MSDIVEATTGTGSEGTNFRKFLADRGVVLVKEFRTIGKFRGKYSDTLSFETLILTVVKSNKKKTSFGVKIDLYDSDGDIDSSVFLDFDELDELLQAIKFIQSTASELASQERDHTEVTYSTKDEAKVGFYQDSGEQNAFFSLPGSRSSTFLRIESLSEISALISKAKDHLLTCGAQAE